MLLVVNDHVLKGHWPGWVTGKLSDFAGLAMFPMLLTSLIALFIPVGRARALKEGRAVLMVSAVVAIVFVLINVSETASTTYEGVLGAMRRSVSTIAGGSWATSSPRNTVDPTDLIAVPAAFLGWFELRVTGSMRRESG